MKKLYLLWVLIVLIIIGLRNVLHFPDESEFTIIILICFALIGIYALFFVNSKLDRIDKYLKKTGKMSELFISDLNLNPFFKLGFTFKSAPFLLSGGSLDDLELYKLRQDFQRHFWFSVFLLLSLPLIVILLNVFN